MKLTKIFVNKFFKHLINNMSSKANLLKPPDGVANMKELNLDEFTKPISIPFLDIRDAKVSTVLPHLKKYLWKVMHYKPIVKDNDRTLILLNPIKVNKWSDLEETDQQFLEEKNIGSDSFGFKQDVLKYENYSAEDIFRAVLPKDKEGMASFTKIGHIVHVNLREHLLPYKSIIGRVLHDKVPECRTVVNKVDMIDNTYRNFQMEILYGDNDFMAKLKENKCNFEFDFSKVYWNSRLCTEHERIVNMLQPSDVLFDVFAGVGPFSVPTAKKKCTVYANDLNPESFKWLKHNAKINKVGNNLQMFNKDGREFILTEVKQNLLTHLKSNDNIFIVMNLPALAVEFLNAFIHLYSSNELDSFKNAPTIIVYCFAKGEDPENIAKKMVMDNFGFDMSDNILEIFKVRTVSSMKEMMRVSIKLDKDILVGNKRKSEEIEMEQNKKSVYDLEVAMGKNKSKKSNNVFKVAGAKSLKAKAKAKPVKANLKNIKVKSKVQEIDKELVNLQDKLHQSPEKNKNVNNKGNKKGKQSNLEDEQKKFDKMEKDSKTVLKNLDTMQM